MFKNKILFAVMMGVFSSYAPTFEEAQSSVNQSMHNLQALEEVDNKIQEYSDQILRLMIVNTTKFSESEMQVMNTELNRLKRERSDLYDQKNILTNQARELERLEETKRITAEKEEANRKKEFEDKKARTQASIEQLSNQISAQSEEIKSLQTEKYEKEQELIKSRDIAEASLSLDDKEAKLLLETRLKSSISVLNEKINSLSHQMRAKIQEREVIREEYSRMLAM